MSDESKNNGSKPGKDISDRTDELIGKGRDLADQAEDFFAEKIKKAKKSDAYGKLSDLFGKAESFMEEKSKEFQSGEMGAKFEAFKDKAEIQAEELVKKAREAGQKFGDQVDEKLDQLKGKKDQPNHQNGGGI